MRRLLACAALLAACAWRSERPNVLFVTIDTLRPDAIGRDTPGFNAFFKEATRFRGARTVAPLTLPSHVSLFTGLLPARHGVHDNVAEPLPPREARFFPLLAEQFRDAGYATAAFVARAVLAAPTGIASGFDVYDCPQGFAEGEEGYVPGDERIRAALEWMADAPQGRPWFVWVHLFDPHAPYRPFPGDEARPPTREGDPPRVLYAGEVRRADAAFEKLVRGAGDAIVVLASDHGEGLFDHDEPTHGPLCYGSTIDAVLALRAPGFEPGAVDTGLRCVTDVAPTLRRLCRLPPLRADGKDLRGPPHETLVAESLFTWRIHGWGQCFSVTDGELTLIESGARLELYDRRHDPNETLPLPFSHPAYEKLDRALERFRNTVPVAEEGATLPSVPPYGELRRRGVGYLSRRENLKLLDPREHLKTWAAIETVPSIVRMSRARRDPSPLENALQLLKEIEERAPGSPRVDHYRAEACAALAEITNQSSWLAQAAWAELAAIEKGYVQPETILPAIRYCMGASDADALRTLVRLLKRDGRKFEGEVSWALAEAASERGLEGEEARFALR